MASSEDPAAAAAANNFNEDVDILLDDDEDEISDDSASSAAIAVHLPPQSTSTALVTVAAPPLIHNLHSRQEIETFIAKKPAQSAAAASKLFQRLWTDEDEIELLQGFLDYTAHRGGPHTSFHHHHDTTAFYDQIKSKFQLDFNKNQLVEKLRRLKKKYRNIVNKFASGKDYAFKSSHEKVTFEISSKIWGRIAQFNVNNNNDDDDDQNNPNFTDFQSPNPNCIDVNSKIERSRKRNRSGSVKIEDNNDNQASIAAIPVISTGITGSISSVIEETVKKCLTPILKELLSSYSTSSNLNSNGFGLARGGGKMADERWRKQHILELEVFSKRLDLVQDQIKEQLMELKSMEN
ncbi:hypothetical protein BUALT_Bualt13G0027400 [Buddleja alternifolia]|uniref:Glabrous enhancer-binding protein-like DBD domain-containing protein n=1 Tax=Buddleja alternifolia TaxID=168488 RepID=A0AAV6WRY7_9LAMI|nr:hypothetical protein BUALT_Bualt13G0027400 [Buddleja alternifolia]